MLNDIKKHSWSNLTLYFPDLLKKNFFEKIRILLYKYIIILCDRKISPPGSDVIFTSGEKGCVHMATPLETEYKPTI